MKRKHIITTLFVSLATTFGVLAGTFAQKEDKAVKAATDDTGLYLVSFDASTIPSSYRDQCSNFRIYLWFNGGLPAREYYMHETGIDDLYMVNVGLNGYSSVAGYQLRFDQNGDTKYSVDLSGSDYIEHINAGRHFRYSFDGGWSGDKWEVAMMHNNDKINYTTPTGTQQITFNQSQYDYFEINISDAVVGADYSFNLEFDADFTNDHDYVYDFIFDKNLIEHGSAQNTFRFKETGWYRLYITNNYSTELIEGVPNSGFIRVKKDRGWSDPDSYGYVYYVSENSSEAGVGGYPDINMYPFAAAGACGSWPGTDITSLGYDDVDCVFGFKFQNKQTYCHVYRIKYPFGGVYGLDEYVIFNFPNGGGQTADLLLQNRAAYWRNTEYHTCNYEAGAALEVIYDLQSVLEEVSEYTYQELSLQNSVCAISQSEAARLYRRYIALPASVRQTYIDASYINTYNSVDATGKNYISAYDIFTLLGQRGGVIGNSRISILAGLDVNDASTITAIVVVAIISTASVGAFFTLKKKKHN